MTTRPPNPTYRVVCGTGPRQLTLGDPDWLAGELPKLCTWLRDVAGTSWCISGLALGFDSDWAEAVLEAGLRLCVAIPFEGQDSRWTRAQQQRYARLRAAAHRVHVVGVVPDGLEPRERGPVVNRRLFERNVFMLDHSTAVATGWEPGRFDGGTNAALRVAADRGMPGVHLDPVSRTVSFALPGRDQLEGFALYSTTCRHVTMIGTRAAVTDRLAGLHRAGHQHWQMRRAKPREQREDGCEVCLEELAWAALTVIGAPERVQAPG